MTESIAELEEQLAAAQAEMIWTRVVKWSAPNAGMVDYGHLATRITRLTDQLNKARKAEGPA